MRPGDVVEFHRVTGCQEIWMLHAGGPVELHLIHPDGRYEIRDLSLDLHRAGSPATTIGPGILRAARLAAQAPGAMLQRSIAPGQQLRQIEKPGAAEVLREHPLHEAIIMELTSD
jgi:predicted cupin superfamily sugar epimerase